MHAWEPWVANMALSLGICMPGNLGNRRLGVQGREYGIIAGQHTFQPAASIVVSVCHAMVPSRGTMPTGPDEPQKREPSTVR